ncbi:MAG: glutathione S-transferase family protein [Pseudomonadales bacterium]
MKVHGFDISNYFNIVKQIVLECDLPVEFVHKVPSRDEAFLAISPMGKVPAAETEFGLLSETRAIVNYIGNSHPELPLFPKSAWDKARTEELISIADLYIESQARRLLAEVFFGGPRDDRAHKEVRGAMEKGLAAFERRAALSPYLLGDTYSVVDIHAFYCFFLASQLMQAVYSWDIIAEVPGLTEWYELVNSKATTQQILAEHNVARKAMLG